MCVHCIILMCVDARVVDASGSGVDDDRIRRLVAIHTPPDTVYLPLKTFEIIIVLLTEIHVRLPTSP